MHSVRAERGQDYIFSSATISGEHEKLTLTSLVLPRRLKSTSLCREPLATPRPGLERCSSVGMCFDPHAFYVFPTVQTVDLLYNTTNENGGENSLPAPR